MSSASASKSVFFFGDGGAEGDPARPDRIDAKGAVLAEMTTLGVPVPPGFTVSAKIRDAIHSRGTSVKEDARARDEIAAALAKVGRSSGARFGDRASPLLVSVRPGSRTPSPGTTGAILNLGMNDTIAVGLAEKTGSRRFALDNNRRSKAG